ncbi:hypothetical protein [Kordia sp. SMS9]|uniref:hypothetical protein n=1 Tax=Kordia sp. SMS9 TaxID=2282170 RepID=UPI0013B39B9A|nr:hypothetical protein [Kordia sp. SMS9]
MKAETVYNVIQALPKEELPRLYRLLGMMPTTEKQVQKVNKRTKPITDALAEEFLRVHVFRVKK